ncbi:MAG: tRNA adenosine(34) deaminase TadA [Hungatella sp.]
MTIDEKYMKAAIREAKKAGALGEVPIGCVVVYQERIIGRGYNRRMVDHSALSHAEILAIKKACKKMGDWRLEDCTMYVTLEPCPMCAGAIIQARIPRVVMGCRNPKAGCAGSVLDMLHEDGFNHQAETQIGILEEECSAMLKAFFRELRHNGLRKGRDAVAKPANQNHGGDGEEDLQGTADNPCDHQ